jgi:hypothetical protein
MPAEDPSSPFSGLQNWSPSWIRSVTWLPYDPVWAPLAAGASGVASVETVRGEGTPSAVRLTTGTYDVSSEEALVERDLLGNRLGFFYGNFRSAGRDVIGANEGQNLLLRFTRPLARGSLRGEWGDHFTQVKWTQGRKLRREESKVRIRSTFALGRGGGLEARAQLFRRLWRWNGLEGVTRRREKGVDVSALSHLSLRESHRLVGAARVHYIDRSWEAPGLLKSNPEELGMALAVGWRRMLGTSRWRLSAGLELRERDGRSLYPVVSLGYRRQLGRRWNLRADAWSAVEVSPVLAPANGYEEILLRGAPEELGVTTSIVRLHHVEMGIGGVAGDGAEADSSRGSTMVELSILFEDRESPESAGELLLSEEPGSLQLLQSESGLGGSEARIALVVRGRLLLPLGFWTEVRGTRILSPSDPTDHQWLPAWTGGAILGTSMILFRGDIVLDGRLTWTARTEWNTPFGKLSYDDNVDAEVRAWVGQAALFAIFRNIEDDIRASSSYDGGWIPRPRRNGAVGVTWRFTN